MPKLATPDQIFAESKWIWPQRFANIHNSHAQFRHDFDLARVPRQALLYITADHSYKLYVNGQYITRGPARGFQHRWPYDEVDLAGVLKPGHNWISVEAYNPGISHFSYIHHAAAGLLVAAKWGKTRIATDPSWQQRISLAQVRYTPRLSVQMGFQEHIDARQDDRRWITAAKPPRDWVPQRGECRPFGIMPWHGLESRGLPLLSNEVLDYRGLVSVGTVSVTAKTIAKNEQDDESNPSNLFADLLPRFKWESAASKKCGGTVKLPASASGKALAVVLDLLKPSVGSLILDIAGGREGERLDVLFSEVLDDKGVPFIAHQEASHSMVAMAARVTLRAKRTQTELTHLMGHRYLILVSYGSSELKIKANLRQTIYPMQITGSFESGNAELNDIHRISVQTQQVCSLDSYVDTPWREQAQWWGDARVQSQNTFHLCDDTRLLERGIDQIATQEVPNGLTYGHAPTIAHGCVLPDFSLIWLITLWDLYNQTGDATIIKAYWPRVQRVLSYFRTEGRHESGLLRYDPRYWLFMDWCDLPKDGCPTLLNLWYLYALDKLIELTGVVKMEAEQRELIKLRRDTGRVVDKLLWDAKKGMYRDGLNLRDKPIKTHAIHNQTLAILIGLQPKSHRGMMDQRILPYLADKSIASPLPSSYWVTYVYEAAAAMGHASEAIEHLHRHWSPMISCEGTQETFNADIGNDSCTHAWAAHPIFHLVRSLVGVTQTSPGWKTVTFNPLTTSSLTDQAQATVPTPLGLIEARWKRTGQEVQASLSLPKGITAMVTLPQIPTKKVRGSRTWRWKLSSP